MFILQFTFNARPARKRVELVFTGDLFSQTVGYILHFTLMELFDISDLNVINKR